MARRCSICTSSARDAVDRGLVEGRAVDSIAVDTGLAASSIRRHRDRHLGPRLSEALVRREQVDADKLAGFVLGLQDRTLLALARAEQAKEWPAVRGLIREARENVLAIARLVGILDAGSTTIIDARKQQAIFANLTEEELRALARTAVEGEPRVLEAVSEGAD
jgi:hypothetical protein